MDEEDKRRIQKAVTEGRQEVKQVIETPTVKVDVDVGDWCWTMLF